MWWAKEVMEEVLHLSPRDLRWRLIYDVAHNIVKVEKHSVAGEEMELAVHRKGATRAFPPGHPEVPVPYRAVGQPVVIPGDMGTCSYLLFRELEEKGIHIRCVGRETVGEEMPDAYKNVTEVVDVVVGAGLAKKVLRLRPVAVVKG